MEAILTSSTTLFGAWPPTRKVTSAAIVSNKLCSDHISASTKRLFFRSPSQRRQQLSSSPNYYAIPKLTIKCGAMKEIDESEFSSTVLKSDRPVLVEFVANWCGPCRLISPAMESIAQEYEDKLTVVKIDHDANPRLIEEYKVYGLPTLILFKNGQEVPESRREGAITKVKLKEYVDALLETVSTA